MIVEWEEERLAEQFAVRMARLDPAKAEAAWHAMQMHPQGAKLGTAAMLNSLGLACMRHAGVGDGRFIKPTLQVDTAAGCLECARLVDRLSTLGEHPELQQSDLRVMTMHLCGDCYLGLVDTSRKRCEHGIPHLRVSEPVTYEVEMFEFEGSDG